MLPKLIAALRNYCLQLLLICLSSFGQICIPQADDLTYGGHKETTIKGSQCQRWDDYPRSFTVTADMENYCRNPDNAAGGPWCYTNNGDPWEYCFPEFCEALPLGQEMECYTSSNRLTYTGTKNTSLLGYDCQRWDSQSPQTHRNPEFQESYCRNADDAPLGPWCYTTDPSKRYDYCFHSCPAPSVVDCIAQSQSTSYSGDKSITVSGYQCDRWDAAVARPYQAGAAYPTLSENYCRNPDSSSDGPWCYTKNPSVERERCFDFCVYGEEINCYTDANKITYSGTHITTLLGYTCQRWDSQSPHTHSKPGLPENFCRNADNAAKGPWCYTTNPAKRYDYCFNECHMNINSSLSNAQISEQKSDSNSSVLSTVLGPLTYAKTWLYPHISGRKHEQKRKTRIMPHDEATNWVLFVIEKISCTMLAVGLSLSVAFFALFRISHYERQLQMGTELSLLIAHILIICFAEPGTTKNDMICDLTSFLLQFLLISHFGFMAAEAFQYFCRMSNIISSGCYFNKIAYLAVVPASSLAISCVTAVRFLGDYDADLSCWIDFDHTLIYGTYGPIVILTLIGLSYTEAAGMDSNEACPLQDKKKHFAASIGQKWLYFKIILSFVSYLFGTLALFFRQASLISVVSVLHASMGYCFFLFHVSCDVKVLAYADKKIFSKLRKLGPCLRRRENFFKPPKIGFEKFT